MDISKIQSFMNYTPTFKDDPIKELNEILDTVPYISKKERKEIIDTYEYTKHYHKGVKRLSGEPYIIHPLKVLGFLVTLKPDVPSMKAALLHDLIEDTEVTYDDVEGVFGEEVATLCEGLVKVSKVRYRGQDRQLETLKKTFLAMAKDLRVIIIKIADRVHNIQTLHFHPKKEKRDRIALETLKVYVPIAKRLGLYVFQGFLENGAFAILEPKEFKKILGHVMKMYGDGNNYKINGTDTLERLCKENNIPVSDLESRLKSPYRIRKKLGKYNFDISKIMDILAFRIVTDDVNNCYTILGLIHKHYTPIFSKMKDYIALPKPNGYKSLHTTVLGMFDFPVEIQVRTEKMDYIANYGVAAHYAYSEETPADTKVSDAQAQWIKRLQDIVQKYTKNPDKELFKQELDIEILQKNIFVYTPKGDILELPQGSTVLDFAFRIHTEIGLKFKNALINSKIVPIDYKLKTGDIVAIENFKRKYTANGSWSRFLHTPSAKNKLNRYLRQEEKDDMIDIVEGKINKKLVSFDLPRLGTKKDRIKRDFSNADREDTLYKVRDKQITVTRFIKQYYPELLEKLEKKTEKSERIDKTEKTLEQLSKDIAGMVVVDGNKLKDVLICPECTPKPGSKIIGRSGKDGIKVHLMDCEALSKINYKKLVEAHRDNEGFNEYVLHLKLLLTDRPGMLLKILRMIDFLDINVLDIGTAHEKVNKKTQVDISMSFTHPSKMGFMIDELKSVKNHVKILSTIIK